MDEEETQQTVGLPGPLHRILVENIGVRSPLRNCKNELNPPSIIKTQKSPSPKQASTSSPSQDKENAFDRQRMELGPQPKYNSSPRMDSEVELSCLVMDDSMLPPPHMQRQLSTTTPERYKNSTFITADNISSILTHSQGSSNQISLSEIHSPSSLEGSKFKTPKRSVPSGPPRTPGSERTPSSCPSRTPGSSSKSGSSGRRFNPFDSHRSWDPLQSGLHFSPSVFATVVSPSQECSDESRPFWTIEQQSELYPHPISEESPLKQSLYVKGYDPNDTERENMTQEAIEKYFAENHSVTSPPDLPPTGPLLNSSPDQKDMSYSQPCQTTSNKWCQTTLTFPVVMPSHLENILKQYFTFQEPQVTSEEQCNLSNSTLRRKLFNAETGGQGSDDESERSASPDSEEDNIVRGELMTPGRVIHTPVQAKTSPKELWSSSPVRHGGISSSISPPDNMGSPILSPIGKERRNCLQESIARLEEEEEEVEESRDMGEEMQSEKGDASDEMWQTAEIPECHRSVVNMDTDSQLVWAKDDQTPQTPSQVIHPSLGWQSSWSLTLPTQDETNADSNVHVDTDTGYNTNTRSLDNTNNIDQTPSQNQPHTDSGVSTSHQLPADLTGSVLGVPVPLGKSPYLVSYANETTNDISVGFPLGSSTPSKK